MFHVSPGPAICQQKPNCGIREDEDTPSWHVVSFLFSLRSQTQLNLEVASGAENCWSRPLTMIMMNSNEDTLGLVPCGFLIPLNCSDNFLVDPAIAPVRDTGHQLVTLRCSIFAEERAQILDTLKVSKFYNTYFIPFVSFVSSLYFSFTELDAVLQHLGQGPAPSGPCVADTSDTSADESETSHLCRRVRSKRTYKMKKVWGANEVGGFFVTGDTDAAGKASHFYCRICRKDVSVLTHGPHEFLRQFQGVKHFARVQRLRLETPGWRVLDLEDNPISVSELERQRERILRGPLVIRNREYPFIEDVIVDDFGARMPRYQSLPRCCRWLKCCDWAAPTSWFTNCGRNSHWLPAKWTLTWHGLVMRCCLVISCSMFLRIHVHWLIVAALQSIIVNEMYPCILSSVFGWVQAHEQCSIKFEERGSDIWVMVRSWKRSTFRSVCVAVLSRFSANTLLEAEILGKFLDTAGPDVSVVSLHGCLQLLAEAFASSLESGHRAKLVEYPTFDLQLMKRCLRQAAASVFGSLEPFSLTEFVVNCLKGAETRDWMTSRPALRKAISMAGLVDVVANIVGYGH